MALTERLAILIEASAGQAVAEFKKVGAAAQGVKGDAAAGTKAVGGLGQAGAVAGSLLKAGLVTGATGAGVAITKFAADGVKDFVKLAGEVKAFKDIAGGTAESASQLVAAFGAVGIDATTAANGVFQLEKRLTTGAGALAGFGVVVAKDSAGNTNMTATLLSVADAYKATQDPAARATLLTTAFGKAGTALVPLLSKSREQIQALFDEAAKHHEILTQADLDKATAYKLATHDLSEAVGGLGREVGEALVPSLTGLARALTDVVEDVDKVNSGLNQAGTSVEGFFDKVASHAGPAKGAVEAVGTAIKTHLNLKGLVEFTAAPFGGLIEAVGLLGKGSNAAAVSADEAITALNTEATAVDGINKALFSYQDASRAVDASVRDQAAAERDLADKQRALSTLLKAGAVDQKAVASATKDVADAEKELTTARKTMATAATAATAAEQALADLRSGATAAKNAVDHADDIGKAQLGVTKATKGLGDAQDALVVLQKSGTATSRQLSDAQDDVTQATFDLHDANATLITTQDTVNQLLAVGAENSPEVVAAIGTVQDAHDTLATATDGVATAIQNVSDKQAALGTVLAGDPNYADNVRAARQAVADATQHVADAMFNVAQNREKFQEAADLLNTTVAAAGPTAVDDVRNNIQALLDKKPELAAFFDPLLADLNAAAGLVDGIITKFAPGTIGAALVAPGGFLVGNAIGMVPGHAAGGLISGLSVVGEKGPELFAGHGTIIPNNLLAAGGGSGGGGGTTVNVSVNVEARVDAGIDMGTAGAAIAKQINSGITVALDDVVRKVKAGTN